MALHRSVEKTLSVRTEIEGHLKGLLERPDDTIDNITLLGTKATMKPNTVIKLRRAVAAVIEGKSPDLLNDLTKLVIKNF